MSLFSTFLESFYLVNLFTALIVVVVVGIYIIGQFGDQIPYIYRIRKP